MRQRQGTSLAFSWAPRAGLAHRLLVGTGVAGCCEAGSRMRTQRTRTRGPPVIDEPLEPNRWRKLKEIKKRKFNKPDGPHADRPHPTYSITKSHFFSPHPGKSQID